MTKVFQHTLHRQLWMWLAENPEKTKDQWPSWKHIIDKPYFHCWACEYTIDPHLVCSECPVIWKAERCEDKGSEYQQWQDTDNLELRSALALEIVMLSVRPGVICV